MATHLNSKTKEVLIEFPLYKTSRKVWALKIDMVIIPTKPATLCPELKFQNKDYPNKIVTKDFLKRYNVQFGGYFVTYANGHEGYLSAEDFRAAGFVEVGTDLF